MANIIIKGKTKMGRTRSQIEENLRKEWGPTITDGQLHRIKHIEKCAKKEFGNEDNFISAGDADKLE